MAGKADRFSLPWPKLCSEMVAVVLEHVEGLVLDLPTGAPARGKPGDVAPIDGQIGDEAVAAGDVAGRVDDLDVEPVDGERVLAVADRQVGEPAVAMGLEAAALFDPLFVDGEFDAVEPVVERGVRSRLGNEQEMAANRLDGLANRLAGIEIVAEMDRFQPRQAGPVGGQPAPRRPALAVLLLLPVLGNDELRG